MAIIDTHSHIYDESFDEDRELMLKRARLNGVSHILMPNINIDSLERIHRTVEEHKGYCLPMMGLHPTSVSNNWQNDLDTLRKLFETNKYIAVGEIGIDLYWDKSYVTEQKDAFCEQLKWSIELDLPVSIHARQATDEVLTCIRKVGANKLRGVFHSFSGDADELRNILSLGDFLLGINGMVTFKNSSLSAILKETSLSHLVIETDAPYLSPVPFRGKRNEPSYTRYIVEKLAQLYNVTTETVSAVTTANAKRMFGL